jgi:hypothetical protein
MIFLDMIRLKNKRGARRTSIENGGGGPVETIERVEADDDPEITGGECGFRLMAVAVVLKKWRFPYFSLGVSPPIIFIKNSIVHKLTLDAQSLRSEESL